MEALHPKQQLPSTTTIPTSDTPTLDECSYIVLSLTIEVLGHFGQEGEHLLEQNK